MSRGFQLDCFVSPPSERLPSALCPVNIFQSSILDFRTVTLKKREIKASKSRHSKPALFFHTQDKNVATVQKSRICHFFLIEAMIYIYVLKKCKFSFVKTCERIVNVFRLYKSKSFLMNRHLASISIFVWIRHNDNFEIKSRMIFNSFYFLQIIRSIRFFESLFYFVKEKSLSFPWTLF